VTELHFDYSDLAPFEKGVMRRIVPFYSFSRKALPLTGKTLLERPGGVMAQTIRASNPDDMGDGPIPEYVAETASIPLERLEDGSMRYLTGFGLAHEDPLSLINDNPVMELL